MHSPITMSVFSVTVIEKSYNAHSTAVSASSDVWVSSSRNAQSSSMAPTIHREHLVALVSLVTSCCIKSVMNLHKGARNGAGSWELIPPSLLVQVSHTSAHQ